MKHFARLVTLVALPLALAAPVLQPRDAEAQANVIPNRWIAIMKDSASASDLESTLSQTKTMLKGAEPDKVWDFQGFKGFAFGGDQSVVSSIQELTMLESIEPDSIVTTQANVKQQNPPYGLARISHRKINNSTYVYDNSAGKGIVAYGIDTGIYIQHSEFEGRAEWGKSFIAGQTTDGNGHGTHTAATLGGKTYGVAKNVHLVAVKVLNNEGSGSNSNIISGIEWAVKDMNSRGKAGKAVANISLGGLKTGNAVNNAVKAATNAGLFIAVAAGNSMADASLYTPASAPSACTVAASDGTDTFAYFSNYGTIVDIIAPGVDVKSAYIGGPQATEVLSGTSMSTPHIAGLGAYLLALEGTKKPVALCNRIRTLSTKDKIEPALTLTLLGQDNYLAFNGATS